MNTPGRVGGGVLDVMPSDCLPNDTIDASSDAHSVLDTNVAYWAVCAVRLAC